MQIFFTWTLGTLRRLKTGFALDVLPLLILAVGCQSALANTEQVVSSIYDGNSPYLIVVEDLVGASRRAPGIYTAGNNGDWNLAIPGRLITGRAVVGILEQLEISKLDKRYQSIAVVDGTLRLFNVNTTLDDPASQIVFGSEETPLVDVISGMPVALGPIHSIDDISVLPTEAETSTREQMVLFSVRHPSPLGDGLTFAVLLKAGNMDSSHQELIHTPVVVDYKFQSPDQLLSLVQTGSVKTGVISRSVLQYLSRKKPKDNPPIERWRLTQGNALQTLEKTGGTQNYTFYDLASGQIRIPIPPTQNFAVGSLRATQYYDVLYGKDGLITSYAGFEPQGYLLNGRIDLNSDGLFKVYPIDDHREFSVFFMNRELFLSFTAPRSLPSFIKLSSGESDRIEKVSKWLVTANAKEGSEFINEYYLIISQLTATGTATTEVLVLSELPDSTHLQITKRLRLSNAYYAEDELKARTSKHDGDVLFDVLTPVQNSLAAYQQAERETAPRVNLTLSNASTTEQSYLKPLEEHTLATGIKHIVYDEQGALSRKTGIYLLDSEDHVLTQTWGELLNKRDKNRPQPVLMSKEIHLPSASGQISVVAVDGSFSSGISSFKLLFLFSPKSFKSSSSDRESKMTPVQVELPVSIPFKTLAGIQLLPGKGKNSQFLNCLLFFDDHEPEVQNRSVNGVMSVPVKIQEREDGGYKLVLQSTKWLDRNSVSPSDIQNRIGSDKEGRYYWVATPAIEATKLDYKLIDLKNHQEVYPNQAGNRIKDLHLGAEKDEIYDEYRYSSWEIHSRGSLIDRTKELFPDGEKTVDTTDAALELFPELLPILNQLAAPSLSAEHRVFLVSDKMKDIVKKAILELWMNKRGNAVKRHWDIENRKLRFYLYSKNKSAQDELLKNLQIMKTLKSEERPVLFADAADIIEVGRPSSQDESVDAVKIKASDSDQSEAVTHLPHALYLLGTEGEALNLADFKARTAWNNRIPMAIISTPEEWDELQHSADLESAHGLPERFKVDTTFLTGSWKLWPPGTSKASDEIKTLKSRVRSDFYQDVFPGLTELLDGMADPAKPAKHEVLIVPPEILTSVKDLILERWAKSDGAQNPWNYRNNKFSLYRFSSVTQDKVFENLLAMHGADSQKRTALFADLSAILASQRPEITPSTDGFMIEHHSDSNEDKSEQLQTHAPSPISQLPHILYLLDTEGKRVQLADYTASTSGPQIPMLFIGTAEQWREAQDSAKAENTVGFTENFHVSELHAPDVSTRVKLLKTVLQRSQISALQLKFSAERISSDAKNLSPSEAEDNVLAYIVARCDLLSRQFKKQPISSYIKFLNSFALELTRDEMIRKFRTVDRVFVEKLLSKVFSMPLNLEVLPPSDPLVRLKAKDAVLELQKAGYEGPLELKARVIRTLLAQTRHDPVKPIPSSAIVFGDSRTGKTFLFKTIVKMLGLPMYDFRDPNNKTAQAIIINVGKLHDSVPGEAATASSEEMSVNQAIAHIKNFLQLPNGYRGYILFDDAHLGSDAVKAKLFTFIRSLFEANEGMYLASDFQDRVSEVPVRNLTIMMTLNPTDDWDKRRRFYKNGDPIEVVLASIAGKEFNVERSFFERWSLVMDVSRFPAEAKAPKLRDSLRDAARDIFNNQNRFVIVSSELVGEIARQFKDDNANFLSKTTPEILAKATELGGPENNLAVVVSRNAAGLTHFRRPSLSPYGGMTSTKSAEGHEMEAFIHENAVSVPIKNRFEGRLQLLNVILSTFRTQVYENFVSSISQDPRFARGPMEQRALLAPFLHAVVAHLTARPDTPLHLLNLDPHHLGVRNRMEQDEFIKALTHVDGGSESSNYPVRFGNIIQDESSLAEMLNYQHHTVRQRNRIAVLNEITGEIGQYLQKYLSEMARVESVGHLPDPTVWLKGLAPSDSPTPHDQLGKQLTDSLLKLQLELYGKGLVETNSPENYLELSAYDAFRLFLIALDHAVTRLPWGHTLQFLVKGLDMASSNMALGQLPGVQNYLFGSKFSLLRPASRELLFQMAITSEVYNEWPEEQRERVKSEFSNKCGQLLTPGKG